MKVQEVIQAIESIAPRRLAFYPEDNNGLLVGSYSGKVRRVLLALDLTQEVLQEASKLGCQMIITHHPFIFKGLKNIREDNVQGKIVIEAIRNNIHVYSAHTNLDVAQEGVNEALRIKLGLPNGKVLQPTQHDEYCKLAIYVPQENSDEVLMAISKAGAGHIGQYSHCSFKTQGEGSFKPLEGSRPYIGSVGEIERVREVKLETIVSERKVDSVIKAMKKAHPYEEIAYDIIPLKNPANTLGLGQIIELGESISAKDLAQYVKERLNCQGVKLFGNGSAKIARVAICGGSGSSVIHTAKYSGCQCLITGDIDYHKGQMAVDLDLVVIDAGHYHTEVPVLNALKGLLEEKLEEVDVVVTEVNTCPYEIV